ncbi:AAA family ATPase [Oceanobacillus sp. CF4.6]|uniref:AAA family ATPase n=1 Tax=Oceanobacillus sp. CF4.6 TaxID=3373080 RepID=UPI003EE5F821
MKQLKLINLELNRFKGVGKFELNAAGENVQVFGDNATGKTTLFDAFVWLLFDKDSQNKKDFQIKTLQNGKVLHKLDHEVEATLEIDNTPLTLKKVYKEKWTKKRGSVTSNFSGHTTDYFVDGVPSKRKEFEEKVASIVDENIFKLLTNPSFFNEQLGKNERRDLLLEIAGDITAEDVITSNPDLKKLIDVLGKRSIEDHKKVIAAKRKEINQELDRIPIRIDELSRGLPDINGLNKSQVISHMKTASDEMDAKLEQINNIRNGGEVNKLNAVISDIDLKISSVKNEHAQQGQQEVYGLKTKLQEEQSNVSILQSRVSSFEQRKGMNDANMKDIEDRMQTLRNQWKEQSAQEFDHESNCSCPSCGQDLPEEQLEEVKANFNRNKSQLLETVNQKGVELKNKLKSIQEENESTVNEIEKLNSQIEEKQKAVVKLESRIKEAQSIVKPITENASYNTLMQDRQATVQQIEQLRASVEESVKQVQQEIQGLKEKHNGLSADLSALNESERAKGRISELEQQEKELASEYEQLELELHLTEEFIRAKVNLLEDKINSKFRYARFNLFKENINGGIEEICETTYEGVPYSSGLNNAARINVGLDIIDTLSKHYGVQAPIFVDNAESITRLIDIDSQIIGLVVSESDKQLRVETKEKVEVA